MAEIGSLNGAVGGTVGPCLSGRPESDRRLRFETTLIVTLSLLAVTVWFATQHIGYTSDSTTYLQLADYLLLRRPAASFLFFRTPGYPSILILGGVPIFGSFVGVLFIQAVMAVTIPVLVHKTIRFYAPRAALLGAILVLLTWTPITYSKTIMTEQAFIFLLALLIYLAARFERTKSAPLIYWIAGTLILLAAVRPSANMIGYLVLAFLLLLGWRHAKHVVAAAGLVCVASAAWSCWVALHINPSIHGSLLHRTSQLLFHHIYSHNTPEQNYLDPENGENSRLLQEILSRFATRHVEAWAPRPPARHFAEFRDDPTAWVRHVYAHPIPPLKDIIPFAVDTIAQTEQLPVTSALLLHRVSMEAVKHRPTLFLSFVWRMSFSSTASFAGQQLFYHSYVSATNALGTRRMEFTRVFDMDSGPASRTILAVLREFLIDYPHFWETREPFSIFAKYAGDPERLIKESILDAPNIHTYWFMWNVYDTMRGPTETPRVFMAAALENFRKSPQALAVFVDNLVTFFLGPVATYNTGHRQIDLTTITSPYWIDSTLPEHLKHELTQGLRLVDTFDAMTSPAFTIPYGLAWAVLKPLLYLVILGTIAFAWRTEQRWLCGLLACIITYQALVVAIFGEPLTRYIDQVTPVAVLLAVLCAQAAVQFLREPQSRPGAHMENRGDLS